MAFTLLFYIWGIFLPYFQERKNTRKMPSKKVTESNALRHFFYLAIFGCILLYINLYFALFPNTGD